MKWRPITNQRNYKKSRGGSSTFSYYSVRYFLIPTVVKPEVFSSAKPHGVLTTMCPCHHESPSGLTRKYDFYVYPNSIMTFFSKVNISHFFNDKKEADKSSQPLFLTLQTNQFSPLSSFFAFSIWYFTWSNPVPPKEFRL